MKFYFFRSLLIKKTFDVNQKFYGFKILHKIRIMSNYVFTIFFNESFSNKLKNKSIFEVQKDQTNQ